MPRMTADEYARYLAQQDQRRRQEQSETVESPYLGPEAKLQHNIEAECRRRGWIAIRSSMAHPTHRTKGEPDFTVYASAGRTFKFEVKRGNNKLSPEQQALIAWAESLGHEIPVIRSFAQFLEMVDT